MAASGPSSIDRGLASFPIVLAPTHSQSTRMYGHPAFTQGATTTTTNYVYDGPDVVEEVDANGIVVARYTNAVRVDDPLAQLRSGTLSYYEPDGIGSNTSLSNSGGAIANTYTYDSFGK